MILKLDFDCEIPIYQQIRNQIVLAAARGELQPGERLPSMRTLAEQSGINMMTVNKAYQLLKQEGILTIDRRSGARITADGHEQAAASHISATDSPGRAADARPQESGGAWRGGANVSNETAARLRPRLELLIGEARLRGMGCEEFLTLCRRIYKEQAAARTENAPSRATALILGEG